jgi:hypothetical protein
MLFYVQTAEVSSTQIAKSHKEAAIKFIKKQRQFGKFTIVSSEKIVMENSSSFMFFCTQNLLQECDKGMKVI